MYGRWLTAQQKDERRQDNDDKKRLVRHHLSDLLRSLTREQIGGGQHGVVSPALRALPFRSFYALCVRHLMRMCIPSIRISPSLHPPPQQKILATMHIYIRISPSPSPPSSPSQLKILYETLTLTSNATEAG